MSEPVPLSRKTTSLSSTGFVYDITKYPGSYCRPSVYDLASGTGLEPQFSRTLGNTAIYKLLEEETHAALSGTGYQGRSLWVWSFYPVLYKILSVGMEHSTQYLLRIEPEYSPQPYKPTNETPDVRAMIQRALDLSGLTRKQLASALGVRRQSVHNWLTARAGISPERRERLQGFLALLEQTQGRFEGPRQVSSWLTTPVREDGSSPLDMIANGNVDAARGRLLRGRSVRRTSTMPTQVSRRVPRRAGPVGYSPAWTQPSRPREFDPEEGNDSFGAEEGNELYRDAPSQRVTGLARA